MNFNDQRVDGWDFKTNRQTRVNSREPQKEFLGQVRPDDTQIAKSLPRRKARDCKR
jgi:hypothetical protein